MNLTNTMPILLQILEFYNQWVSLLPTVIYKGFSTMLCIVAGMVITGAITRLTRWSIQKNIFQLVLAIVITGYFIICLEMIDNEIMKEGQFNKSVFDDTRSYLGRL